MSRFAARLAHAVFRRPTTSLAPSDAPSFERRKAAQTERRFIRMSGFVHSQLMRFVGFAAVVMVIGLGAVPASAHENLVRAVPANGSTVTSSPARVQLVFDEKAGTPAEIVVTGPSGDAVDDGPVRVADNTVSVRVDVRAAGRYTVAYRVVSADGHPVSGQTTFRFAPGGAAEAGSAQPSTDEHAEPAGHTEQGGTKDAAAGDGLGRGAVVGIAAAGAALLAGVALLTGRRRPGGILTPGSNPARNDGS